MIARCLFSALLGMALSAQPASRQILPAGPGPQRLEVDLGLLGASRAGLADLRIRDAAGREVPYVLVPPGSGRETWTGARILPLPATRTTSGVELDPGAVVRTSRLRLQGLRAPFLKRFNLEGSGDRQRWTELVKAGSLFDLPGEGLRLLDIDFPEGDYRYLRLTWDDRSSAPLAQPNSAQLLGAASAPALTLAELPFARRSSEPGVSRFTVGLPGPRLPLRALVLSVRGEGPLLREAQVFEARLSSLSLAPRSLGSARLRRALFQGDTASEMRIPVEVPEGSELDLKVLDGDNPGLDLAGVKAELEPQPWIYFEARDASPLTATCGRAGMAAPSYDLEALRDRLPGARAARASWGPGWATAAPGPEGTLDLGTGPALDFAGFRCKRAIPPGPPGLAALALDAHVLATSANLQDLRLLDASGRQIPYLPELRDEPLALDLPWPAGTTLDRVTTYRIQLPQAGLPASRLVLETATRVFRRQVRVLQGEPPALCASEEWSHGDTATAAPALVLALPALAGRTVTVEVEEGDNQALAIGSARLLLPSWRLRFFRPAGESFLCYGRDLRGPDYDIALLAGRLRAAPAQELVLAPGTAPAAQEQGRGMVKLFWAALVLAVLGLVFLLARVLHKDLEDPVAH